MSQWKRVEGREPLTDVHPDGRVRKVCAKLGGVELRDFEFIPSISRGGYRYIVFREDGKQKNVYFHRVIADAFIPNPEGKPFVNHKDGDKGNNAVDNLEWVTQAENTQHAYASGLMTPLRGEDSPSAVLTNEKVREIKARLKAGETGTSLAEEFKVSTALISRIKSGQRWGHI